MARTVRNATTLATTGIDVTTLTAVDAANGESFTSNGRQILIVNNGSGSSMNVTVSSHLTVDGIALGNRVVAVAAGVRKIIGPFPGVYNQDTAGTINVDYSSGTTVTAGLYEVPLVT